MNEINLNCGIYQIRNIVTNVCYGGQSIHLKQRPSQHWSSLKYNKHKNSHLQNSYNKRGREFFVFEILIYCAPKNLTYYEQLFCDIDKSHGLSYNVRDCVDSNRGIKRTEETKKKISESLKGKNHPMWGKHHSLETIEKMIKNHADFSGENGPMFGKNHSEETKEKMRIANSNPSEETRERIAESARNRPPMSEETKEKLSIANSGENHPMFGKHHSEESILKNIANQPYLGKPLPDWLKKKISEGTKGKNNPFYSKTHSKETINGIRQKQLGKRWITNLELQQNKFTKGKELENCLQNGWTHGRKKFKV